MDASGCRRHTSGWLRFLGFGSSVRGWIRLTHRKTLSGLSELLRSATISAAFAACRSGLKVALRGSVLMSSPRSPPPSPFPSQPPTVAAPAEEKVPSGPLYILSPEMAKFVGVPKLQRTQCLKKVWEYVKANALQDGRDIRLDATLATMFESPLNGPQIMKQLSRHMVEKIEGSSLKGQCREGFPPQCSSLHPLLLPPLLPLPPPPPSPFSSSLERRSAQERSKISPLELPFRLRVVPSSS